MFVYVTVVAKRTLAPFYRRVHHFYTILINENLELIIGVNIIDLFPPSGKPSKHKLVAERGCISMKV